MVVHSLQDIVVDLALPLPNVLRLSSDAPFPEIPLLLPVVRRIEDFYLVSEDALGIVDELIPYYNVILQHLRKYTKYLTSYHSFFHISLLLYKDDSFVDDIYIHTNSGTAELVHFLIHAASKLEKVFFDWPIDEYNVQIKEQSIVVEHTNVHHSGNDITYIFDRHLLRAQLIAANQRITTLVQTLNEQLGDRYFVWPNLAPDTL